MKSEPEYGPWCGCALVDLQTWCCPDCGTVLSESDKMRLEQQPTKAPEGHVWVLASGPQDGRAVCEDGANRYVDGVFSDRAKIAARMIRAYIVSADDIRKRQTHWYQGFYNPAIFEGWDEGEGERSSDVYELRLRRVDDP